MDLSSDFTSPPPTPTNHLTPTHTLHAFQQGHFTPERPHGLPYLDLSNAGVSLIQDHF